MRAIFPLKELIETIEKTKNYADSIPSWEFLTDPANWDNNTPLDEDGLSEEEFEKQNPNGIFNPDPKRISQKNIQKTFSLIGSNGIFLQPNKHTKPNELFTTYAKGCNPNKDEDWYENKRAIFGGDDDQITVPTDWILQAQKNNNENLVINITPTNISLVSEFRGNKPKNIKPKMRFVFNDKNFEVVEKSTKRGSWICLLLEENKRYRISAKQLSASTFTL